tara:strand:+ start:4155 stop:4439 length:285 start_codon:yes stop_codon:yes gene_type:complete
LNWTLGGSDRHLIDYNYKVQQGGLMTDDQRLEMIDNQLELMESICASFVEGDELQDVGNIRAIYEEYSEWFDARNSEDEEYITAWCPRLSDCAG